MNKKMGEGHSFLSAKEFVDNNSVPEPNTGCILFFGTGENRDGYARINISGVRYSIHRFVYILKYGHVNRKTVIRHKCDTPACVNVDHLEAGTQADNVQDMHKRGRANLSRKGTENPKAKLNEQQVEEIRKLYKEGMPRKEIQSRYSLSTGYVWKITSGQFWPGVGL